MKQSSLHMDVFHIPRFSQPQIKNMQGKKIQENSKKQNMNLLHIGNYLHSVYIVFTTIYIAFTLY